MPSLRARLFGFILLKSGLIKRQFGVHAEVEQRLLDSRKTPVPQPKPRSGVAISKTIFEGRDVWHIAPAGGEPAARLLYFHGGGYVYPISTLHWSWLTYMAKEHRFAITVPLYPLAPEARVEAAVAFGLGIYRDFAGQAGGPFLIGGDSAGGGMTAVVAQAARDAGLPKASGLVLICPWLDAEAANPLQPLIEPKDCMLTIGGIRQAGNVYAGGISVADPRVSPINGNWDNLPPILCFAGGADILLADARALKSKLASVQLVEADGMMHVWPVIGFLPESREASRSIADFAARVA